MKKTNKKLLTLFGLSLLTFTTAQAFQHNPGPTYCVQLDGVCRKITQTFPDGSDPIIYEVPGRQWPVPPTQQ